MDAQKGIVMTDNKLLTKEIMAEFTIPSIMRRLTDLYDGLRDAIVLERIRVPRDHRRMAKFVRAVAPALDGIAMIRGSEDFLISLDGSEEDSVRCYAKFLLMTLHPHGIPPPIPVDVPWHRPHISNIVVGLAYKALTRTVLTIGERLDEAAFRRALGYGLMLQEAPPITTPVAKQVNAYLEFCRRLPSARESMSPSVIGFIPQPNIASDEMILPGLEAIFGITRSQTE